MEPENSNRKTFSKNVSYDLTVDLQGDRIQIWMVATVKKIEKNFGIALSAVPDEFNNRLHFGLLVNEDNFIVNALKDEI